MTILVTGGAGYIGAHAVVELVQAGHRVVVLDNLHNGSEQALRRVEQIAQQPVSFVKGDVRDRTLLKRLFAEHDFTAVLHFAGLKAVGESWEQPLAYYENNVGGSIALCQAMAAAGVFRLVFSSSATVYGEAQEMPITEACPSGELANPYGRSKRMVEQVLTDLAAADSRWSIALLRYFNPVGAHPSGLIGEDPQGVPNNLVPFISQVAVGRRAQLQVFGGDFPTRDGTGIRDYIHVVDLVRGHLAALAAITQQSGINIWNLGTGRGYSVLEMVAAFEQAAGRTVPYRIVARRPGDVAECWSDPSKAARELGWRAEADLAQMMADTWRWQQANPYGYQTVDAEP
ncbi:MAG TPA: UDP-glucose 4-epimerase GalE [Salinisphaeraceae bacterium]|nr:UDP-glucose 4-epimerase GalE [Salinisphaeraceae bacterium]